MKKKQKKTVKHNEALADKMECRCKDCIHLMVFACLQR
jgi:hypothetical protein